MSKEREIQKHLIEKDSTGMIDWDSIIDDLSTNLYIDESKSGDNTIDGNRLLFDAEYRKTILAADATGTLPDYLNPRPFINKLGLTYQEARHDEIKMNIKNMDFTNKILEEDGGDIDPDIYYVGELTLSELFDNLDFGNDGVLGVDDAKIILAINAAQSGSRIGTSLELFKKVFPQAWEDLRGAVSGLSFAVEQIGDEELEERTDILRPYDNYHQATVAKIGGLYRLDEYNAPYINDQQGDSDLNRVEYTAYFNPDTTVQKTANAFFNKIEKVYKNGGLRIDPILSSKILYILDGVNEEKPIRKAYMTKEEFIDFVKYNTSIFPPDQYSIFKSCLNLLMPRYARRVEVEDLNKNFWVLGQVCDAIGEAIWREDGIVDAIQALIKQLNYLSSKVNLINLMFGFDGDTKVKLTGDKFTSMCQGYDFTNLYVEIQRGNGLRKIKVPIYNNLNNYSQDFDYTDFSTFCKSWNQVGDYPVGGDNHKSTALNIWDIYQSTVPFEVHVAQGETDPSSKSEIDGTQVIHPFFYYVSTDSDSANTGTDRTGWYLKTLDYMLSQNADFQFVKDLNIIMYNPYYYDYKRENGDEFTLTEAVISDKTAGRQTYTYDATKVLAMPSNELAELELIMLNFSPNTLSNGTCVKGGTEIPTGFPDYSDYEALNLHLECASRAAYRYEPSFVLKDAQYGRKTGIGIQYLCPGLTDKYGEKYRDIVYTSNMLIPIESLTAPCTGEFKEVSESKAVNIIYTTNAGCNSYITLTGETGRSGITTYIASGSTHPQGLVQHRISQALNNTGMSLSSDADSDPSVNFVDQARYIINEQNTGNLWGSRRLTINDIQVNGVAEQSYTWDGDSYNVRGGWYKTASDFTSLIVPAGNSSTNRVPYTYMTDLFETTSDNKKRITGLSKIKTFCESIGLIYGNAFAIAQFPNKINPAAAPCILTGIANYGDAYISKYRHARQVFIIPICYDFASTEYETHVYADLEYTATIMFNWEAVAKDAATNYTEVRYFANNIDQCWVDNSGAEREWIFDHPPIGYIIIAAAANMPSDINPTGRWAGPNGDCDFLYSMFYGKKISNSSYLFMWPDEDNPQYQNAWKKTNLPDENDALTIKRIDNNIIENS